MSRRRWPVFFASLALLFAGVTNAHSHVHVCLDGAAPAAAAEPHAAHAAHPHHAPGATADHAHETAPGSHADTVLAQWAPHADPNSGEPEHNDVDVDIPNRALAKTLKFDQPAIAPTGLWQPLAAARDDTPLTAAHDLRPRPPPAFLRPQLRGPPR